MISTEVQNCINSFVKSKKLNIPLLSYKKKYGKCLDCHWNLLKGNNNKTRGTNSNVIKDCKKRKSAISRVISKFRAATNLSLSSAISVPGPKNKKHWPVLSKTNFHPFPWNRLKDELLRAYIDGSWNGEFKNVSVTQENIQRCYDEQIESVTQEGLVSRDRAVNSTRVALMKIMSGAQHLNFYDTHVCNVGAGGISWVEKHLDLFGYADTRMQANSFSEENRAEWPLCLKLFMIFSRGRYHEKTTLLSLLSTIYLYSLV